MSASRIRLRIAATVPRPSRHLLDLAEVIDGWAFVLGWCAHAPEHAATFALHDGVTEHAPLLTITRQDVVDYLVHAGEPGVEAHDAARGFVFAVRAQGLDGLTLVVPGQRTALAVQRIGPGTDPGVPRRYLGALAEITACPGSVALTAHLRARLAVMLDGDASGPSLAMLRAAADTYGRLFAPDAPPCARRVALLAIHQRGRVLTASQSAMAADLTREGADVVLINSAPDSRAGMAEAQAGGDVAGLVRRSNHGRDIASWLVALDLLAGQLGGVEHLVLCNDSFFGPFAPLGPLLAEATDPGHDVWALTDSWERGYHLQSSFMVLSRAALDSQAFARFRDDYTYPDMKDAVVVRGEIGLSRALIDDGRMRLAVHAPYHSLSRGYLDRADALIATVRAWPGYWLEGEPAAALTWYGALLDDLRAGLPRNPQHVFWEALLDTHALPFVKREMMQVNPAGVPDHWRIAARVAELYGAGHAAAMIGDMRQASRMSPT